MFALKICGAILVFTSCFFAGYNKSMLISCKANTLYMMIEFLTEALSRIHFKRDNACSMLYELSQKPKYKMLCMNFSGYEIAFWQVNIEDALAKSAAHHAKYLQVQDFKVFSDAIKAIGTNSAEEDEKQIEYHIFKLENIYKSIKQDLLQKKKMYIGVGAFSGAALAIILL